MVLAKRLSELLQIEPVPEEMIEHGHAGSIAILHDNDGHAGWRHPRDEPLQMGEPFLRRNVIQRVRTEHEVPLRLWISSKNRRRDGFGLRNGLFELRQQMGIRFDGNRPIKRAGKRLGHLPVSGAGVDINLSVRQAVNEFLEEALGVSFLIGVIEKDLERPLVGLALRVENLYRFWFHNVFLLLLTSYFFPPTKKLLKYWNGSRCWGFWRWPRREAEGQL